MADHVLEVGASPAVVEAAENSVANFTIWVSNPATFGNQVALVNQFTGGPLLIKFNQLIVIC